MMQLDDCPCGRRAPYAECCGVFHRGEAVAPAAEDLMRSRYSAFAKGEIDYLIRTLHPSKRAATERRELERTVKALRWAGLTIRDTVAGGPLDSTGVVEFEARYEAAGEAGALHERSRFVKEDGQWFYVDGEVSDRPRSAAKTGRNDACPCGSGKKFKRCCGAA